MRRSGFGVLSLAGSTPGLLRLLIAILPLLPLVCTPPVCAGQARDVGAGSPPASASQGIEPKVYLDAAACRRFDTAFQQVSDQAHVFIVSEGTLLRTALTEKQAADLRSSLPLAAPAPLDAVLTPLAAAYDYDVEKQGDRTYLLRKRYTDPADLPCVSYEEIVQALRSLLHVVDSFAPVAPSSNAYDTPWRLYGSLRPDQREKGSHSLALADLDPEQQQLALAALVNTVLEGRFETMRRLSVRYFPALKRKSTVFAWVDAMLPDKSSIKAFGFEGNFRVAGPIAVHPLVSPFKLNSGGQYTYLNPRDIAAKDQTVPTDEDRALAVGMLANRLPTTLTLRQAAQNFSARAAKGAQNSAAGTTLAHLSVADGVADKAVNVFGLQYCGDARHFMQSLADLYGLQFFAREGQQFDIELPAPLSVQSAGEVPAEMQRLIPLPLQRAFRQQTSVISSQIRRAREASAGGSDAVQGATHPSFNTDFEARSVQRQAAYKAIDVYYFPTVRRLIALAEPRVPTATSPPVPVESLAPEADRLIALMLLSGECMSEITNLLGYTPPESLIHTDTMHLQITSGQKGSSEWVAFSFAHQKPNGRLVSDGGATYGRNIASP